MHVTVKTDPGRILGKRPNLSAQNSVTDEIVTAFSTQSEPTIPLSALTLGKKSQRGGVIAATVLLFLPFVYPIVFFVHGAVTGHPLPALIYLYLVLLARLLSNAGGLVLYLSARKASFLQKPVGWIALAAFLLPLISAFLFGAQLYQVDSSSVSQVRGWFALGGVALSLVCMLALCVFCVLLLVRVFRKKMPDAVA